MTEASGEDLLQENTKINGRNSNKVVGFVASTLGNEHHKLSTASKYGLTDVDRQSRIRTNSDTDIVSLLNRADKLRREQRRARLRATGVRFEATTAKLKSKQQPVSNEEYDSIVTKEYIEMNIAN